MGKSKHHLPLSHKEAELLYTIFTAGNIQSFRGLNKELFDGLESKIQKMKNTVARNNHSLYQKRCEYCGKTFIGESYQLFCSPECRKQDYKELL